MTLWYAEIEYVFWWIKCAMAISFLLYGIFCILENCCCICCKKKMITGEEGTAKHVN